MYCFKSDKVYVITFTKNDLNSLKNRFPKNEYKEVENIVDAVNYLNIVTSKVYAVKEGRIKGIFFDWNTCKEQVVSFPNATYKGFVLIDDALAFCGVKENKQQSNNLNINPKEELKAYAYVDGSFNAKTNTYGYGVLLVVGDNEYEFSGSDNDKEMATMRNVSGEILGSMRAISESELLGVTHLEIYYDYQGIAAWPNETWKRNKTHTVAYHDFVVKARKNMVIEFVKVKAHSGVEYNEKVDKIAKKAVGI